MRAMKTRLDQRLKPSASPRIWDGMTKEKSEAAKNFKKPAHWSNDPAPAPKVVENDEKLSPTRYGDWEKDGIAVDF
jgi:hypothetical protein